MKKVYVLTYEWEDLDPIKIIVGVFSSLESAQRARKEFVPPDSTDKWIVSVAELVITEFDVDTTPDLFGDRITH